MFAILETDYVKENQNFQRVFIDINALARF